MLKYRAVTYDGGGTVIEYSRAYYNHEVAEQLCKSLNAIERREGLGRFTQVEVVKEKPVQTYRGGECVGYRSC